MADTDSGALDKIISAQKELEQAKAIKCKCSGFVLQYERGCQCERARAIHKAQKQFDDALNAYAIGAQSVK